MLLLPPLGLMSHFPLFSPFQVVVYAKSWCGHCNKAKALLGSDEFKGVSILIRDIDTMKDPSGPVISKTLGDMTGQVSIYIIHNCRVYAYTNQRHACISRNDENFVIPSFVYLTDGIILFLCKDFCSQHLH